MTKERVDTNNAPDIQALNTPMLKANIGKYYSLQDSSAVVLGNTLIFFHTLRTNSMPSLNSPLKLSERYLFDSLTVLRIATIPEALCGAMMRGSHEG